MTLLTVAFEELTIGTVVSVASVATYWYKDNLLMCNHEKFQSMSLGSKHKNKQMKIDVMNNDIESHSEMKLLGVTIDEHLNFSRHIGEVCKNASRKVGVLMRLRNMLTTSAKLKIFISFIMPQITYCHTVWHFCRASDSREMERVQERALRAVISSYTMSS